MFEIFRKRVRAIEARPQNRLAALRPTLAVDAPVLAGSLEYERLKAQGLLTDRVVLSPDEPPPEGPIL
jgi:hypothetical protein